MQRLLGLSNAPNAKASYAAVLKDITKFGLSARFDVERSLSDAEVTRLKQHGLTAVEGQIHKTLADMLPSAALSYRQALQDLATQRFSYRGPAIELREALREVLDHMAPDTDVEKSAGYKQDASTHGPTMAQKARYIMKQRQTTDALAKPTFQATALVDAMTASMVRSTYQSGSVSVHLAPSKGDVQQLKLHVDSALAQLLGIFA
jgi:hypothetical protein